MNNFIKKHSKLIKCVFCFALALCVCISSVSILNNTAKADNDTSYNIYGNVYIKSGNSEFYKVSLYNQPIYIYADNTLVGSGKVDVNGKYSIAMTSSVSADSFINISIPTDNESSYQYLCNSKTYSSGLSLSEESRIDLYFQYYPFSFSISDGVFHNYTMNSIIMNSTDNITSSSFNLPYNIQGFVRNWSFDTIVRVTSLNNNEASFWINIYSANSYLVSIGMFTNGSIFKFKENFYNKSITTNIFSASYTDYYMHMHYDFVRNSNGDLLVSFYVDFADNLSFSNSTTYYLLDKCNYGSNITNIKIERNKGSLEVTNFSLVDYTTLYFQTSSEQYDYGFAKGFREGRAKGYYEGVEDSNTFTFNGLISAVIDAPVKVLTSLFDVEILGMNLKNVVLSLLSLFLVLALVKFLIGKFGG